MCQKRPSKLNLMPAYICNASHVSVCMYACACACAWMHLHVYVCVHACACACIAGWMKGRAFDTIKGY